MSARNAAVGTALLLATALLVGCRGGGEDGAPVPQPTDPEMTTESDPDAAAEPPADVEAQATPDLETQAVRLFFPSRRENGLIGEDREIFQTASPSDRVKQIVADLIAGPNGDDAMRALPEGTTLQQAWVLDDGTAYLDFTGELSDRLRGGSARELLTLYAIIDSVVLNVSEVKRVGVLVSGRPIDTLNGHLDLRRPLPANRSYIVGR